jgi:hypothetical protein
MTNVDYPWDAIEQSFAAQQEVNAAMRVYIESRGLYDKELTKQVMAGVLFSRFSLSSLSRRRLVHTRSRPSSRSIIFWN